MAENIRNYYFSRGAYRLRSKWTNKFKLGLMIGVLVGGTIVTASASYKNDQRLNTVEDVQKMKYKFFIKDMNSRVSDDDASNIVESVDKYSKKFGVDEKLIFSVMNVESSYDKYSVSNAGALGLMQVMVGPHLDKIKVARTELGNPNPFDIDTNIYLGTWVLRDCLKAHKNLKSRSLLCYNGSLRNPAGYDKKVMNVFKKLEKV